MSHDSLIWPYWIFFMLKNSFQHGDIFFFFLCFLREGEQNKAKKCTPESAMTRFSVHQNAETGSTQESD